MLILIFYSKELSFAANSRRTAVALGGSGRMITNLLLPLNGRGNADDLAEIRGI
jgi:hypothetical protein